MVCYRYVHVNHSIPLSHTHPSIHAHASHTMLADILTTFLWFLSCPFYCFCYNCLWQDRLRQFVDRLSNRPDRLCPICDGRGGLSSHRLDNVTQSSSVRVLLFGERPGAGVTEADDRQVTTVFTVQPSFHHRHSTNRVSCGATVVGERAVTPHLVVRRRW